MGAFVLLLAVLLGLENKFEKERVQRIREKRRWEEEWSVRNFSIGLECGRSAVERLFVLLQFKNVAERLHLPESIAIPLAKLFDSLEDYAIDLADGLNSAERASQFASNDDLPRGRPYNFVEAVTVLDIVERLSSSRRIPRFSPSERSARKHFLPQTFQPGSLSERFHRGATQRLEKDCEEIAAGLRAQYTSAGSVSDDELAFILEFKKFAEALNTTMRELK